MESQSQSTHPDARAAATSTSTSNNDVTAEEKNSGGLKLKRSPSRGMGATATTTTTMDGAKSNTITAHAGKKEEGMARESSQQKQKQQQQQQQQTPTPSPPATTSTTSSPWSPPHAAPLPPNNTNTNNPSQQEGFISGLMHRAASKISAYQAQLASEDHQHHLHSHSSHGSHSDNRELKSQGSQGSKKDAPVNLATPQPSNTGTTAEPSSGILQRATSKISQFQQSLMVDEKEHANPEQPQPPTSSPSEGSKLPTRKPSIRVRSTSGTGGSATEGNLIQRAASKLTAFQQSFSSEDHPRDATGSLKSSGSKKNASVGVEQPQKVRMTGLTTGASVTISNPADARARSRPDPKAPVVTILAGDAFLSDSDSDDGKAPLAPTKSKGGNNTNTTMQRAMPASSQVIAAATALEQLSTAADSTSATAALTILPHPPPLSSKVVQMPKSVSLDDVVETRNESPSHIHHIPRAVTGTHLSETATTASTPSAAHTVIKPFLPDRRGSVQEKEDSSAMLTNDGSLMSIASHGVSRGVVFVETLSRDESYCQPARSFQSAPEMAAEAIYNTYLAESKAEVYKYGNDASQALMNVLHQRLGDFCAAAPPEGPEFFVYESSLLFASDLGHAFTQLLASIKFGSESGFMTHNAPVVMNSMNLPVLDMQLEWPISSSPSPSPSPGPPPGPPPSGSRTNQVSNSEPNSASLLMFNAKSVSNASDSVAIQAANTTIGPKNPNDAKEEGISLPLLMNRLTPKKKKPITSSAVTSVSGRKLSTLEFEIQGSLECNNHLSIHCSDNGFFDEEYSRGRLQIRWFRTGKKPSELIPLVPNTLRKMDPRSSPTKEKEKDKDKDREKEKEKDNDKEDDSETYEFRGDRSSISTTYQDVGYTIVAFIISCVSPPITDNKLLPLLGKDGIVAPLSTLSSKPQGVILARKEFGPIVMSPSFQFEIKQMETNSKRAFFFLVDRFDGQRVTLMLRESGLAIHKCGLCNRGLSDHVSTRPCEWTLETEVNFTTQLRAFIDPLDDLTFGIEYNGVADDISGGGLTILPPNTMMVKNTPIATQSGKALLNKKSRPRRMFRSSSVHMRDLAVLAIQRFDAAWSQGRNSACLIQ
eukprot:CAMPEP_0184694606 /NCGR_PEP_ID=MMETSP0313-20130426/2489_1 /TAXON_ID=2792 /ORGANISM="Porphyridium aerugineum, Strain SAG 1380-2" /LENGTH=1101 /DNA_ID=CAMNT_0027152911 /DNA_START=58 /DNA_END=3363 /DNA_ORIENTATION=+